MNVITGEKVQSLCNVFLGYEDDFNFNPYISFQKNKQLPLNLINRPYNNPKFIFCYSHRLGVLKNLLNFFNNSFILISGNSDQNIVLDDTAKTLISSNKIVKWYTQNLHFSHPKVEVIPIGFANRQWSHGNIDFQFLTKELENVKKENNIFMNFNPSTNLKERNECLSTLSNKGIEFLKFISPLSNLLRMTSYKFCVCPIGNGIDTHRLWEALYLKVVPIVVENDHLKLIKQKYNVPMIMLKSWEDIDKADLNYDSYSWDGVYDRICFDALEKEISNLC